MFKYRYLELLNRGPVSRVRLLNRRFLCAQEFTELTNEWNSVADRGDCQALVVDCSDVEFLSSETLSRLIVLQRRLQQKNARLVLFGLRAEVREVLSWTRLDRFFEIKEHEDGDLPHAGRLYFSGDADRVVQAESPDVGEVNQRREVAEPRTDCAEDLAHAVRQREQKDLGGGRRTRPCPSLGKPTPLRGSHAAAPIAEQERNKPAAYSQPTFAQASPTPLG